MHGHFPRNVLTRLGAIATRLCLIVCLWQAPVPWCHCHAAESLQKSSPEQLGELNSHLVEFHPFELLSSELDYGWHCHWILPVWGHCLDGTHDDPSPVDEPVAFDAATVSSSATTQQLDHLVLDTFLRTTDWQSAAGESLSVHRQTQLFLVLPRTCGLVLRC